MNKKIKKLANYMHLIGNYPAFYSEIDGQICYVTKGNPAILRTKKQIQKDQKISKEFRKNCGYGNPNDYSYIRVIG